MCYQNDLITELNPTFLFTWKGTRLNTEKNYHCHDHVEMAFILSGNGKYKINNSLYDVTEGDILILNPGVKHQAIVSDLSMPTTEFFVGFTDIRIRQCPPNAMLLKDNCPVFHTIGDLRQKLFKLCMAMATEYTVKAEGRYFMLQSYLMQMLLLIIREQVHPDTIANGYAFASTNKQYIVEQITNYLEEHYQEKISLDQIAENMYLSPYYISRIFKTETGDTPIRHLINIRLEHAFERLKNEPLESIQETAAAVGYDDAYHFSKLFKKKYGISPSTLKKSVSFFS